MAIPMNANMNRIPITPEGFEKAKTDLDKMRRVDRREIGEAIKVARAHGDLSENAEYHSAKEQQALLETRIMDLESKMALFDVIAADGSNTDKVEFGATVKLKNVDTEELRTYTIVGEYESDFSKGKISIVSPIAKSLIGKLIGDEVTVTAPSGEFYYEILEVSY